jgi:hypothetical protein
MSTTGVAAAILPNALTLSANNLAKREMANALMPTTSFTSSYGLWIGIGVLLLVVAAIVIGVALYKSSSSEASPWWSDRIRAADASLFRMQGAATDNGPVPPAQPFEAQNAVREEAQRPESWCFVGEDLEGRWCVKVPSRDACDANRVFGSRSDCELVSANALPSGVVNDTRTSMTPLSARPLGSR